MVPQNESFLSILRVSLSGGQAQRFDSLTPEDWKSHFALAASHKILPLFAEGVYRVPGAQPELARHRSLIMQQVMIQTLKTDEFLSLYRAMGEAGIRPLVVKGIICRTLYPKPDLRISADEDLLVPPEQFDDACRVLEQQGLVCVSADTDAYELGYRKPDGTLYIELHRSLFGIADDVFGDWNRFFTDCFDRAATETIQHTPILTLEPTDHLFYLICHAMKHFLHSGFGIRQICDLSLFANAHGASLDWSRITAQCSQIRALDFTAAMFRIGEKYLTFDPEKAQYPSALGSRVVDELPMLEDLLSGGIYGSASMSRVHSSNITLEAASAGKAGQDAAPSLRTSLFPDAKKLETGYPYLKKHPWMLPAAWGQRLVKYGLELSRTGDSSALEAVKIGARRVELLRQYGIIGTESQD